MLRFTLVLLLCLYVDGIARPCIPRDYDNEGTVCVCNSTYCDDTGKIIVPEEKSFVVYTSSKSGLRFLETKGHFTNQSIEASGFLSINRATTYQRIHGFGASITDAAGINIKSLSEGTQDNLMRSCFDESGSGYNLIRIPIGGCDFSTRAYTYADQPNDFHLEKFNLADEDLVYKIPLLKRALQLNPDVKIIATAWTGPPWMKTNGAFTGFGFLIEDYYQLYVDYLMKFLDEYKDYDVKIWAITTGNEPFNALVPPIVKFNDMGWTTGSLAKWILNNLGPTIRDSKYNDTKILVLDDQRFHLPWWVSLLFSDERVKNYTDGIAVHWYWDDLTPNSLLDKTHQNYPDKFIIMTEACIGDKPWELAVVLGSWFRGEKYILDIMENNLQHWVGGWIDWNLALNERGGPNWVRNYVDSAIIVNATSDEFYKQPMFYAIAHFSKFIPRDSIRIETITNVTMVSCVAFVTPKNHTTLVLYNKSIEKYTMSIHDPARGYMVLELPPKSISSVVYR